MENEDQALPSEKHPREYGAVLKGLTPEAGSDSEAEGVPASKRAKLTDEDENGDAAGIRGEEAQTGQEGNGDALDTGMLIVAHDQISGAQRDTAPSDGQRLSPSADSSRSAPEDPASTSRQGWNRGVSLGKRTSFGGGSKSMSASASFSGAVAGASTTIGSQAPLSEQFLDKDLAQGANGAADEDDEDGDSSAEMSRPSSPLPASADADDQESQPRAYVFRSGNKDWRIPAKPFPQVKCKKGALEVPYWTQFLSQHLGELVLHVINANQDKQGEIDHDVMRAAFERILRPKAKFLIGSKDRKSLAMDAALSALSKLDPSKLEGILSQHGIPLREPRSVAPVAADRGKHNEDARAPNEPHLEGGVTEVTMKQGPPSDVEEGEDRGDASIEVSLHALYFPSADGVPLNCLYCTKTSHQSANCPELTCRFCGSRSHSRFGCPTKQRCSKCHQIGHPAVSCTEKLALARSEWPPCVFCGADHLEEACSEVTRSYYPETEVKKVQAIPTFCYTCGALDHYGPECVMTPANVLVSGNVSWTKSNRDLYVDPNSSELSIALGQAGLDPSQVETEFHVPGNAKKQTHVYVISSDDSEDDFIRPPVPRPPPRNGDIRIGSDVSHGAQQHGARPPRQPPLPPGPPPRGNGYNNRHAGSRNPGPPSSLPPRPPNVHHQYQPHGPRHHDNRQNRGGGFRGGRGGRGGGGGGGGGRGRGRR